MKNERASLVPDLHSSKYTEYSVVVRGTRLDDDKRGNREDLAWSSQAFPYKSCAIIKDQYFKKEM